MILKKNAPKFVMPYPRSLFMYGMNKTAVMVRRNDAL